MLDMILQEHIKELFKQGKPIEALHYRLDLCSRTNNGCNKCSREQLKDPNFMCPLGRFDTPSKGFGDTVEKVLNATGVGPIIKQTIEKVTGKPCGCNKRKEKLNQIFPYQTK